MSVYHRDIRQYIGKRSVVRVKAAVLVLNDNGELLLLKRQNKDEWGLPLGNLKPGEALEDTASRELWEESGLTADDMRLLDLVSGPEYMKKQIGGDEVYYVIGVYAATGLHSAIHLSPNTEVSLKYFDFQALPVMDAITVRLLDKIKKNS
ncbi:NUDIX domain-containing protein [Paenibacillus sp. ISL-20]|uniref:NUDIX domain-containing protein n=1 Tax=Paenibacillus sp. ISL-20 TaxID=2819163 RepID=UPI001BEC7A09|nr:NUDIX domain-containing protein [Paenibacillus sp. ISL-20]MBT2759646.1 NUDIX domain-containing protein [Paenibacillus sp. ISL-20]